MRDNWFCGSFGTVPLNFLMHVQNCTGENCIFTLSFLANWNLYPMTESTERSPKHKWRKYILRVEGGGGISLAIPRKCSPLAQIRRGQEKPGPLLLVYFMTGCVKCCTFLFIDVIVGWFCVTFCVVFSFLFSDVEVYKEGLLCTRIFHRCRE